MRAAHAGGAGDGAPAVGEEEEEAGPIPPHVMVLIQNFVTKHVRTVDSASCPQRFFPLEKAWVLFKERANGVTRPVFKKGLEVLLLDGKKCIARVRVGERCQIRSIFENYYLA